MENLTAFSAKEVKLTALDKEQEKSIFLQMTTANQSGEQSHSNEFSGIEKKWEAH